MHHFRIGCRLMAAAKALAAVAALAGSAMADCPGCAAQVKPQCNGGTCTTQTTRRVEIVRQRTVARRHVRRAN
jgi:hypothetical protein